MPFSMPSVRRRKWRPASILTVALLLSACASGPYGLSPEEWRALSPEEQARYEGEYIELQQARDERAASEDVNTMLNRSLRKGTGAAPWDRDRYSY